MRAKICKSVCIDCHQHLQTLSPYTSICFYVFARRMEISLHLKMGGHPEALGRGCAWAAGVSSFSSLSRISHVDQGRSHRRLTQVIGAYSPRHDLGERLSGDQCNAELSVRDYWLFGPRDRGVRPDVETVPIADANPRTPTRAELLKFEKKSDVLKSVLNGASHIRVVLQRS